ncbi:DUF1003 domain-containing protein [Miniimonas sp. S16]|nr:DUF1003 domain-containing protein [Miniimonas sp. S16]
MAGERERLDTPLDRRGSILRSFRSSDGDSMGRVSESIARFLGTPSFIIWLTMFCIVWILWNTLGPELMRFDSASNGFTALTLMLSLQASYAAPLILLAQNRQTDRDRVAAEQDRQRTERNLADTEFLAREMAALRLALQDVATRDYLRGELRDLLEEVREEIRTEVREEIRTEVRADIRAALRGEEPAEPEAPREPDTRRKKKRKPRPTAAPVVAPVEPATDAADAPAPDPAP